MESKEKVVIRKCIRFNPDNYQDRRILEVLDSLPERQQGNFVKNAILASLGEAEVTLEQEQSIRAIVEDVLAEKGLLDMRGVEPDRDRSKQTMPAPRRSRAERAEPESIQEPPQLEFGFGDEEEVDDTDLLQGLAGFSLSI